MDDKLATPAYQIRFTFLIGEPGELRLEDGFIVFTIVDGDLVFRASLREARVSFPKVTFHLFFPLPGTGIKLAVGDKTYRLSFVRYTAGSKGSTNWSWGDIKQGRAAVWQWRAALGQARGLLRSADVCAVRHGCCISAVRGATADT
jgi:hypothetical protein